jgi:magnesium transporter
MITYYFRTIKDVAIKTVTEVRTGIWVHVETPTAEELDTIITNFALDDDIIKDSQDFFEVPRLEKSEGFTYFFTRYPYRESSEDSDTAPLLIVMGESFVMTVSTRAVPAFERLFSGKEPVITTQKAKLFMQIMDSVTRAFDGDLVQLRKAVQRDRARLRKIGTREIERLVAYENKLNNMIDALIPTNSWLQLVPKGNYMQLYSDDMEQMQDLLIANNQLADSARSVLKTVQNVRSAAEAILTNNLNATIRTLTIMTIILTVPTIVASLFGMNVQIPFENHPYAFWFVLGFIMTMVAAVVFLFKRNKWL